jgi:hypothetical protein
MRWMGHVVLMGEVKSACSILAGKPEGVMLSPGQALCKNFKKNLLFSIFHCSSELDRSTVLSTELVMDKPCYSR